MTAHPITMMTRCRLIFVLLLVTAGALCVQSTAELAESADSARTPCASLENLRIPPAAVGLPTSGATVTSAAVVPATPLTVAAGAPGAAGAARAVLPIPEYCKVLGSIAPVDPTAPAINFQVNLPLEWNRKMAQMGGSGLNGSIPVSLTTGMQWGPESIPPNAPYALSRGFVVFGSDSGHGAGTGRGGGTDWVTNRESLTNFASAQMKKTHDVAVALVTAMYGAAPRHSYYFGSSQGGREALMVVQRFPRDYDGVFVQVPVFPQLYWNTFDPLFRAKAQVGAAWIPPAKVALVAKEVLRQCDTLDGLADGLVSNYIACNDRFDPAVSPNALANIRCPDGTDAGESCLSDPQVAAVNQIHGAVTLPFPLHKGWTTFPGWTTGGEGPGNWKTQNASTDAASFNAGWLRTLIVQNPTANLLQVNLEDYRERIQELSAMLDATDPDLSAFRQRGGRLIWKVNTTDYTANPRWSYEYYKKIVQTMGQRDVDQFLRFYVAVGIFHNRNVGRNPLTNETVPNYLDFIALLDDWVDKGKTPADVQVLSDMEPTPPFAVKSTLPMCRYPQYPRYRGSGDPKSAASYRCTTGS